MEAIPFDVPMPILTGRLLIREPRVGEGRVVNEAIAESFEHLSRWMPWAKTMPTVEESERFTRESVAKFITRRDFGLRIWTRDETKLLGAIGLHPQPGPPLKFEIGYWLRSGAAGKGLMTEAVTALTTLAFEQLHAARVFIRCDPLNLASRRVAEKCGYSLEGILRNDSTNNDGSLRDTCVFARVG